MLIWVKRAGVCKWRVRAMATEFLLLEGEVISAVSLLEPDMDSREQSQTQSDRAIADDVDLGERMG